MVELAGPPGDVPRDAHVRFLRRLQREGILALAGPFEAAPAGATSGMYALAVDGEERARAIAAGDPLVRAGATCTIRRWTRTF